MITTRDIDVDLEKGNARLNQKTTKDIDVSFREDFDFSKVIFVDGIAQEMLEDFMIEIPRPKEVIRPPSISTHNMQDVADILEKKKRDKIMAKMKKLEKKDEKKILLIDNKGNILVAKNKPWNKMNAKERKEYQLEKARKR